MYVVSRLDCVLHPIHPSQLAHRPDARGVVHPTISTNLPSDVELSSSSSQCPASPSLSALPPPPPPPLRPSHQHLSTSCLSIWNTTVQLQSPPTSSHATLSVQQSPTPTPTPPPSPSPDRANASLLVLSLHSVVDDYKLIRYHYQLGILV
jgi:hypothetical protein